MSEPASPEPRLAWLKTIVSILTINGTPRQGYIWEASELDNYSTGHCAACAALAGVIERQVAAGLNDTSETDVSHDEEAHFALLTDAHPDIQLIGFIADVQACRTVTALRYAPKRSDDLFNAWIAEIDSIEHSFKEDATVEYHFVANANKNVNLRQYVFEADVSQQHALEWEDDYSAASLLPEGGVTPPEEEVNATMAYRTCTACRATAHLIDWIRCSQLNGLDNSGGNANTEVGEHGNPPYSEQKMIVLAKMRARTRICEIRKTPLTWERNEELQKRAALRTALYPFSVPQQGSVGTTKYGHHHTINAQNVATVGQFRLFFHAWGA